MSLLHFIYVQPPASLLVLLALAVGLYGMVMVNVRPGTMRVLNAAMLLVFTAAVFMATVFMREKGNTSEAVLTPFWSLYKAVSGQQTEYYREIFMNMLLFFPVGFLACAVFCGCTGEKHAAVLAVLLSLFLSVCAEGMQYFLAAGLCETDDVISNTIGAALGCGAYVLAARAAAKYGK